MTAQPATRPTAGSRTTRTAAAGPLPRPTRPATPARGRALLVALGLALAATVLPVATAHASPQAPDVGNQLTNPGGNPQPPEPPDPQQGGPEDLAPPADNPEPPLPPDPPDLPDWGPDDVANPTENPEPPEPPDPPDNGPDDITNPTVNPDPPKPPKLSPNPDPVSTGSDSIPTPQRVDAGFGGTAAGPRQAAGLALIAAAVVLTLLVIVIARRHQAEARSNR